MPQAHTQSSAELAIQLEGNSKFNSPGDTIIGRVIRREHTVTPKAVVTIKLFGRAKSKVTEHANNSWDAHRGCFNLFPERGIFEKVFEGPVHIPPDGGPEAWPFALTIPMAPSPRSVTAGNSKEYSYLPLDNETIAGSSLPATFTCYGSSSDIEAFVEYYLEAEYVQETHSAHSLSRSSLPHRSTSKATLLILLRGDSTPYPLEDFGLRKRIYPGSIKSQHLVPGMETAKLSFHQQMRQVLGSPKVPEFGFNAHIEYPGVIQLQNPNPIPFKLWIVPNRERTSDILEDIQYTLAITSLTMTIIENTSVICYGSFSIPHYGDDAVDHKFAAKKTILGLPDSFDIQSGLDTKALDLGASLQLTVFSNHARVRGKALGGFPTLRPSFITYNIKHSHQLRWEMDLELAGESVHLISQTPVSLLAASGE